MKLPEIGPRLVERTEVQFGEVAVSGSAWWFGKEKGPKPGVKTRFV